MPLDVQALVQLTALPRDWYSDDRLSVSERRERVRRAAKQGPCGCVHEQASQHTLLCHILRGWGLLMSQMESFVQVHVGAAGVKLGGRNEWLCSWFQTYSKSCTTATAGRCRCTRSRTGRSLAVQASLA